MSNEDLRREILNERDALRAENEALRKALELCRFSIKNENHVSGDVAKNWIEMIDAALAPMEPI